MFESFPQLRSWLTGALVVVGVAASAGVAIMSSGIPFLNKADTPSEAVSILAGAATLRPTFIWANSYGLDSTLNGEPLPIGAIVEVFDPDGTLAGRTIVQQAGRYGLLAIYADDPSTDVDEGVVPGDRLTFAVDGHQAQTIGPDEPVWQHEFQLLQIDLEVDY